MTDSIPTRIGIVTGEDAPQLTENGRALLSALRDRGLRAEPVVWTDSPRDQPPIDAALLRSCWDYHAQPDAFRSWLESLVYDGVTVLNPPAVVRWNVHKFYLRDLADRGVSVLPTAWVERSSDVDLAALLEDRGWQAAVVKPAVGAQSAGAFRTSLADAADRQDEFESLVADGDVLVQEYAPEIADGERSFVFFEGEFSHATRQYPASDDFRAHPAYGGTSEPYEPPPRVIAAAEEVLSVAGGLLGIDPERLPYARVDSIERDGGFRLMELELIEPYLSLDTADGAVAAFADAVESALEYHSTRL